MTIMRNWSEPYLNIGSRRMNVRHEFDVIGTLIEIVLKGATRIDPRTLMVQLEVLWYRFTGAPLALRSNPNCCS